MTKTVNCGLNFYFVDFHCGIISEINQFFYPTHASFSPLNRMTIYGDVNRAPIG